ncbi:TetR family transcriptional regulator [bacterium]|nr:TetR family transcriptional regulator [bacterium]
MAQDRKLYRREAEDKRRLALIEATLALVSEGGARNATVRAIAQRAGVTAGLIRHYFEGKDQLIAAAYRHLMDRMTDDSAAVLNAAPNDPEARLASFVAASLKPPVVDPEAMVLWATFMTDTQRDAAMRGIHALGYLGFRNRLQSLIAALPGTRTEADLRRLAIAANAVIDGLWMEGSALPEEFANGELVDIGIRAVGAIIGVDLQRYLFLSDITLAEPAMDKHS